jgi:hypothetical protein
MNSLIIFANDLAKHFVLARNKKAAAAHIVYELNSRIDVESNKHLNETDKKFVLRLVEDIINGHMQFSLKPGEMIVRKQADYKEFIILKKFILSHLINAVHK